MSRTPVALVIFNRPDLTAAIAEAIRASRPPKVYVIADGPRADRPDDAERCAQARKVVEETAWDCEVVTDYADRNLGCKGRIASGLSWVFEQTERAVVLEDDLVPEPTFFDYCDALLERYADDERISAISGNNFLAGKRRTPASYYYSLYPHSVGWATWRRAWTHFDGEMSSWPAVRDGRWLHDILGDRYAERFWRERFDATYAGEVDSWAIPWLLSCWVHGGLGVCPSVNLVAHVGAGADAAHMSASTPQENVPTAPLPFPLTHPELVIADREAARLTMRRIFRPTLQRRILRKLGAASA